MSVLFCFRASFLDLVDVWRVLNPDVERFTWRQRQPEVQCRLDFFLVSQSILGDITLTDIVPGYKTDHSMITLNLSLHSNPRGPGFWKLNTSFLTETAYINLVKATIQETQDEYKEDDSVNPALLWDMMKLKVREKTLKYAAAKKKMVKQRETDLEQIISRLEKEIDNSTCDMQNSNLVEQLNEKRSELEKIIEFRTKGAILRSNVKWFNEGEKNTKYYLRLEKRHKKQGTISQLKINENDFITSDQKILSECKLFYTDLYTSKFNSQHSLHNMSDVFFKHENDTVLNEEEQKSCEGLLTERECFKALKTIEAEKTPGSDGLPAEFIKCSGQIYPFL